MKRHGGKKFLALAVSKFTSFTDSDRATDEDSRIKSFPLPKNSSWDNENTPVQIHGCQTRSAPKRSQKAFRKNFQYTERNIPASQNRQAPPYENKTFEKNIGKNGYNISQQSEKIR